MSRESSDYQATIIALALLVAGLATRLVLLDVSLMIDEEHTIHRVGAPIGWVNPAYYYLVLLSHSIFGVSEFSSRLPAALLGAAALPVFFLTWRRFIGPFGATAGALLLLVSSWHVEQSQMARFYSGTFLFGSLAYYFYYRALVDNKLSDLALAYFSMLLAVSFHAMAVALAAVCMAHSAAVWIWRMPSFQGLSRRVAGVNIAVCGTGALVAMVSFSSLLADWVGTESTDTRQFLGLALQLAKYIGPPLCVGAVAGVITLWSRDRGLAVLLLLGIGIVGLVMIIASGFMPIRPRYLMHTFPLIFVAAGALISSPHVDSVRQRLPAYAMFAILVAASLPGWVSHYTLRKTADLAEAIEYVSSNFADGDTVIGLTRGVRYYMEPEFPVVWTEDGFDETVDWTKMDRFVCQGGRVWIILRTGRGPAAVGLRQWLGENSRLVWRQMGKGFAYEVAGHEVYLVDRCDDIPRPGTD